MKAHRLAPGDPSVHLHYGLFLMDRGRNLEAGVHFEEASKLQGDEQQPGGEGLYESLFNAGVAYRQAGVMDKAETFYRKAKDLKPKVTN